MQLWWKWWNAFLMNCVFDWVNKLQQHHNCFPQLSPRPWQPFILYMNPTMPVSFRCLRLESCESRPFLLPWYHICCMEIEFHIRPGFFGHVYYSCTCHKREASAACSTWLYGPTGSQNALKYSMASIVYDSMFRDTVYSRGCLGCHATAPRGRRV